MTEMEHRMPKAPRQYVIKVWHEPYLAVFEGEKINPDWDPFRDEVTVGERTYQMSGSAREIIVNREMIEADENFRVVTKLITQLGLNFLSQTKVPREEWYWEVEPR